jgi:NhaA family Na+:H+ antiporter
MTGLFVRWANPVILGVAVLGLVVGAASALVGATVSLFITGLAFESPNLQADAKAGILLASVAAAALGAVLFGVVGRRAARMPGEDE